MLLAGFAALLVFESLSSAHLHFDIVDVGILISVVRWLLQNGARPGVETNKGNTPMHFVVRIFLSFSGF
jgi:hypothetical protein